MWLPYKGKTNKIKIEREKHMTHIVTKFEQPNEPVALNNNILGGYSADSFLGNFIAPQSPFFVNTFVSQIENFSQSDSSRIVNISYSFLDKPIDRISFWSLYFDGSKSNDGVGAGCILIYPKGEKTMLSCRLEVECTKYIVEYEALIQGLYKAIGLNVKYLNVYGDSKIS